MATVVADDAIDAGAVDDDDDENDDVEEGRAACRALLPQAVASSAVMTSTGPKRMPETVRKTAAKHDAEPCKNGLSGPMMSETEPYVAFAATPCCSAPTTARGVAVSL
jgi:hypothetical protein